MERKKIKIRLPPVRMAPDPPAQTCRLCRVERSHWQFMLSCGDVHVCDFCTQDTRPFRMADPFDYSEVGMFDARLSRAALTVILKLERGDVPT